MSTERFVYLGKFNLVKIRNGGLVSDSKKFSLVPQLPQKLMLASKVVNRKVNDLQLKLKQYIEYFCHLLNLVKKLWALACIDIKIRISSESKNKPIQWIDSTMEKVSLRVFWEYVCVCARVYVCVRERENECMCVRESICWVCMRERKRVCTCVWERKTVKVCVFNFNFFFRHYKKKPIRGFQIE